MSGTPISLLKLASAATVRARGAQIAARMSFVDVLPAEPVMPDDARLAPVAHGAAERGERGEAVVGDERGSGAPPERVFDEVRAGVVDGDEQVAGGDPARVDLDARHSLRVLAPKTSRPRRSSATSSSDSGITSRAPSRRSASRATVAVVERHRRPVRLLALLVALAGDQDDVARLGRLHRLRDRETRGRARPRPRRRRPRARRG